MATADALSPRINGFLPSSCKEWFQLPAPSQCWEIIEKQILFININSAPQGLNLPKHLTHWGRVTHISVSNLTTIGSDNGLAPSRRQAIIWTSAAILLIGHLGTNFSEILIKILTFSFTKMRLESVVCEMAAMLSWPQCVKWHTFCSPSISSFSPTEGQCLMLSPGSVERFCEMLKAVLNESHLIIRIQCKTLIVIEMHMRLSQLQKMYLYLNILVTCCHFHFSEWY